MNNLIAICCLFLVCYGCAGMPDRGTVPDDMTIRDIVSLYPAETSERQIQLSKAVLKSKSTGVFEVCELLGDTTADMRNRAEYALSGVVQNAAAEQYTVIEEALLEALFAALPNEQKIFLLEQLRICGSNAALKSLERLLDHPLLAESVLQTLESIGTVEAAELMFNALPRAGHDLKISVINRLGKLEYRAAAQEILNLAQNESVSIKMAAMQALAILGYTPAGDLLRDNLQNPAGMSVDRAEALYLKFLENKDGDDLKNIRLLDIFRDTTRQDNSRMHAAKIMLASGGSAVLPGIYAELTQASPAFRADVLRMMIPFRDPATANFWRSVLQTADPAERVEIIRFLGWQGEAGSIKYIGPFLKAGEEPVRLEVMQALVKISPGIAAPLLMDHIDENLSEAEADVLFHAFMHIPADFLELNLPFVWDQGTTENRIFITHIIAGRYLPSMNSRLSPASTGFDC